MHLQLPLPLPLLMPTRPALFAPAADVLVPAAMHPGTEDDMPDDDQGGSIEPDEDLGDDGGGRD